MEHEPEKKQISILKKIAVPLLIVALLQPLIFLAVIQGSDVIGQSNREDCSAFANHVKMDSEDLGDDMGALWSDLLFPRDQMDAAYADYCRQWNLTDAKFAESKTDQDRFLAANVGKLLEVMRRNETSGVYLILNSRGGADGLAGHTGVCIRDQKRGMGLRGQEELYLERGETSLASQMRISVDSGWQESYTFSNKNQGKFFTVPLLAAAEHPKTEPERMGYWDTAYALNQGDEPGLSYSIPLISGDGKVYGVLGVEISQTYLKKILPSKELGRGAAYSLATVTQSGGKKVYHLTLPRQDSILKNILGKADSFTQGKALSGGCYAAQETVFSGKVIFSARMVQRQNELVAGSNAIALVGITSSNTLFSFSHKVQSLLIVALFLALAVGILGIVTVSHIISSPVIRMSEKIRQMDDHEPAELQGVGIAEIDSLIDSINHLNENVAKNEERLSTILKLTNYPIGVFSVDLESGYVYSSSGLFYILRGLIQQGEEQELADLNVFVRMLDKLRACPTEIEESGSTIYDIYPYVQVHRWIRVRETEQEDSLLGVVTDVTEEVQRKKRIEYERDYDPLTNLMNRHAFQTVIEKLSRSPEEMGTAAMLMFDVDGLKAINDKYGHDCGDHYICSVAKVLRELEGPDTIVSHISGDEFVVLLYNRDSKDEIREILRRLEEKTARTPFEFPDGTDRTLCVSGGLAWYPADSTDLSILRRYADFTMYQAKESHRGTICEFDSKQYYQDNLGERRKELERILAGEGLQCALHPVVSAVSGEIAAYAAPIAPKSGVLITDEDLLSIAHSQEKLYQVEQVNWKTAMTAFSRILPEQPGDCRLFLRTVPGQCLLRADYQSLLTCAAVPAERIVPVVRLTECRDGSRGLKKVQELNALNLELALELDAHFERSALENLPQATFRYLILAPRMTHRLLQEDGPDAEVEELLEQADMRGITVVCQGVNTRDEFRILRRMDIALLEGPLLEKSSVRFPFLVK